MSNPYSKHNYHPQPPRPPNNKVHINPRFAPSSSSVPAACSTPSTSSKSYSTPVPSNKVHINPKVLQYCTHDHIRNICDNILIFSSRPRTWPLPTSPSWRRARSGVSTSTPISPTARCPPSPRPSPPAAPWPEPSPSPPAPILFPATTSPGSPSTPSWTIPSSKLTQPRKTVSRLPSRSLWRTTKCW